MNIVARIIRDTPSIFLCSTLTRAHLILFWINQEVTHTNHLSHRTGGLRNRHQIKMIRMQFGSGRSGLAFVPARKESAVPRVALNAGLKRLLA